MSRPSPAKTAKRKKKLEREKKARRPTPELKNRLITFRASPKDGVPIVNRAAWIRALERGEYSKIATAITQFLIYFESNHYTSYSPDDVAQFDEFMTMLILSMSDDKFMVTRNEYVNLVMVGHFLSSIAAVSSYKTTDVILHALMRQQNNLPKILMAQNARCELQIPSRELFNLDPALASIWYNNYMLTISQPTQRTLENQYRHLHEIDDRWIPLNHFVSSVYFTSTYFAPDNVRETKRVLNTALKRVIERNGLLKITNNPNPNKIAIITGKWHRNHAVYKSASPLVNQLLGHYDVTLYHVGKPEEAPDMLMTEGFSKVEYLWFDDATGQPHIPDSLLNNDYQMIYYPDIGMSNESIWLSNVRAAPIQAMGYGHPDTSGDNSEIDYFIGGQVEADATQHYAETMVLLPGLAQEPAWPSYERKYNYRDDEVVRVNCVWGPDKYNYNMLRLLRMVADRCKDVEFEYHFFASPGANRYGALVPFISDVSKTLQNFVVHTQQEYYEYMENAEEHDFSLNSFPFGGYNTIVESLYLGLPVITLEGQRFYNRAAAHLLRQIGMPELIASTPQEFVNLTSELILNRTKLKEYRQALADMDLRQKLFTLEGNHFKDAVDHIIANHPFKETVLIG